MEDRPGVWGWVIVDVAADELASILQRFQDVTVTLAPLRK